MKHLLRLPVLLLLLTYGCSKDIPVDGPELLDLFGDFQVLQPVQINQKQADFAQGDLLFLQARFNKLTDWELVCTGLNSGARKSITGKTRFLDSTNCRWNGSTTIFPMFKEESVEMKLIIAEDSVLWRDTVSISSTRLIEGFVVADFETGIRPGWTSFVQSGANMSFVVRQNSSAAQGNRYYDMGGLVNWDWLIGMIEFPASAYQEPRFPLISNPEKLYFNTLLYLPDSVENALLLFQFREDDNGNGTFEAATEDLYSLQCAAYTVNGAHQRLQKGWNKISVRYNELVSLVNGQPATPAGNGRHDPDKLSRVSALFLANPTSGYSQMYMDYIIFTENAPLEP